MKYLIVFSLVLGLVGCGQTDTGKTPTELRDEILKTQGCKVTKMELAEVRMRCMRYCAHDYILGERGYVFTYTCNDGQTIEVPTVE